MAAEENRYLEKQKLIESLQFDLTGRTSFKSSHISKLKEITHDLGYKESRKKELKAQVKERNSKVKDLESDVQDW